MADKKPSIFKKVVSENNSQDELKMQFTVDLTDYDTSLMDGFVEGSKVYTGYTCKLATLKLNKKYPKSRIDIDPSNEDIRKAIFEMYSVYDDLIKSD